MLIRSKIALSLALLLGTASVAAAATKHSAHLRKSEVVRQVQPERDGPCRDINFDPTVLPAGVTTSDDPFPAARSSAYRVSYDRRTAEEKDYPRTAPEAK